MYPAPGVEIADAIAVRLHCEMSVTAEDTVNVVIARVGQCPVRHFFREPQPARVYAVERAHEALVLEVEFLKQEVRGRAQAAEKDIVKCELVPLVAVDGGVTLAVVHPSVLAVGAHAD